MKRQTIKLTVLSTLSIFANLIIIIGSFSNAVDIEKVEKASDIQPISFPNFLDFAHFKQVFNKHYASYTEELHRHKLFVARYLRAFVSRIKYKLKIIFSHFGVNHLSDRTTEERRRLSMKSKLIRDQIDFNPDEVKKLLTNKRRANLLGMLDKVKKFLADDDEEPKPEVKVIYGYDLDKKTEVPIVVNPTGLADQRAEGDKSEGEHYNLIESGCFNPPGDQGDCGSCYLFTGIAIAEYLFCRSSGKSIKFSEQYVLDCRKPFHLDGCDGGTFEKLSKFIEILGFEMDQWYPYQAKEGVCRYQKEDNPNKLKGIKSAGYVRMKSKPKRLIGAQDDWETFLRLGVPLDVSIAVDIDRFSDYAGGVDMGNVTDSENLHSMTLVGSGIERGFEYWLLRNSFGLDWGERGHYKLRRNSPAIAEEGLGETFEAFLDKDLSGVFEFNSRYKTPD